MTIQNRRRKAAHETADRIIYVCIISLVLFGLVGFFAEPKYEKGVWAVLALLGATLTGATGFKFGVTTASSAIGQRREPDPPALPAPEPINQGE